MKRKIIKIIAIIIAVMVLISIYPAQKTEAASFSGTKWFMVGNDKNGKDIRRGEGKRDYTNKNNRVISERFISDPPGYNNYICCNPIETKTFAFKNCSFGKYKTVNGTSISGKVMFINKTNKWHHDSKGWWFGTKSNYATNGFYLISISKYGDSIKDTGIYYFVNGYMVKNQFQKGYWLGKNGELDKDYSCTWHYDKNGKWYGGGRWYAKNKTYKIDGKIYRFNKKGYVY